MSVDILSNAKIHINSIVRSNLFKNLSITFFENVIVKILCFITTLVIIRSLDPTEFGIYSFIMANTFTLAGMFDFGMENTAIRFFNQNKDLKNNIFGLYFCVKSCILIFMTLMFIIFGKLLLEGIHKQEIIQYIPYFLVIFVGESLFFVNDTYLQAIQKFNHRAIINVSRRVLALFLLLMFFIKKTIYIKYIMLINFLSVVFVLIFIKRYIIFFTTFVQERVPVGLLKEIFHYQKWMIFLSIVNGILTTIDINMLSIWIDYKQLGIYAAAYNLLAVVSFLPLIFGKVILPKMTEIKGNAVFDITLKMTKMIIAISFFVLMFLPLFKFVVPIVFGMKYIQSVIILQILSIATLISFISIPVEICMYNVGKPKFIVIFKYFQLALIVILNVLTIPRYGMTFAAVNLVIARAFYALVLFRIFFKLKMKGDNETEN